MHLHREADPEYLVPVLPTPPAAVIDRCCELLSSGRPFSEVLAETKQLTAPVTVVQTEHAIVEHEPPSTATGTGGRTIGLALAGLVAILTTTAGLQGINDPAQPPRVLATALVPPPGETSDQMVPVPASQAAAAKATPSVTPIAAFSVESFVPFAEVPSARAADYSRPAKFNRDESAPALVTDRPRSPTSTILKPVPHWPTTRGSRDNKQAARHSRPMQSPTRYARRAYPRISLVQLRPSSPHPYTYRSSDHASATVSGWGGGRFGPSPYSSAN
jgi:hypothetical protein